MGVGDFFEQLGSGALAVLTTVAPMAATAFGGPLAGIATQKVIHALGLTPNATKQEIETALINATPEQLLALKKMEQDFMKDMKALDIDIMKLHAGDRASARDREVKTGDSWTPRILAALIMILYIAVQWFLLHEIIDQSMREIVMRSLGTLDAAIGLVLGYYFGSSSSSAQKTDQISDFLKNKQS